MVSERTNLSLVKRGVEGPSKPLSFSDWQRFPSDTVECGEYVLRMWLSEDMSSFFFKNVF